MSAQFAKDMTERGLKYQTKKMSKEDAALYRLNAYNDARIANAYTNRRDRDSLSRLENRKLDSREQFAVSIVGKDFTLNQLRKNIKMSDELNTYYAKKGKEVAEILFDMGVEYEPISSYRTYGTPNSSISWEGVEYVRKN